MSNDKWNLQKYLKQLINMGSDNPNDIRLKVSKNDDSYDILKAWFGDMRELTEEKCDADHKIIKVTTSPYMIVHWAMLYGNRFEVLNRAEAGYEDARRGDGLFTTAEEKRKKRRKRFGYCKLACTASII